LIGRRTNAAPAAAKQRGVRLGVSTGRAARRIAKDYYWQHLRQFSAAIFAASGRARLGNGSFGRRIIATILICLRTNTGDEMGPELTIRGAKFSGVNRGEKSNSAGGR
jgi:hypothetical protein